MSGSSGPTFSARETLLSENVRPGPLMYIFYLIVRSSDPPITNMHDAMLVAHEQMRKDQLSASS